MKTVRNIKDNTEFGYDMIESNNVWYFIKVDITGNGNTYVTCCPDRNNFIGFQSFKEALIYLASCRQQPVHPKSKYRIVRSYGKYDYHHVEAIHTEDEAEYYRKY